MIEVWCEVLVLVRMTKINNNNNNASENWDTKVEIIMIIIIYFCFFTSKKHFFILKNNKKSYLFICDKIHISRFSWKLGGWIWLLATINFIWWFAGVGISVAWLSAGSGVGNLQGTDLGEAWISHSDSLGSG